MQTARTRADKVLTGTPLDDGHIDARQGQLAGQHQSRRPRPHDQHIGIPHARQTSPTRASLNLTRLVGSRREDLQFLNFFISTPYLN
jgi:hypothetical protein